VISANAMALVLERLGPISGSASAVAGSLRFGLGALAPVAVAALFDGTPLALALVMAVCGLAAIASFVLAGLLPVPALASADGKGKTKTGKEEWTEDRDAYRMAPVRRFRYSRRPHASLHCERRTRPGHGSRS